MILYLFFLFFLLICLYGSAILLLPRIAVNKERIPIVVGIDIYILTNGVHTDLVLPVRNKSKDWSKLISFDQTLANDISMNYIAIGWGDKGFYLETTTWADLKLSVAFKAMFHLSTSAIHTTYYKQLQEGSNCKKITISDSDYQKLVEYIEYSFMYDNKGQIINIKDAVPYGENDAFYEANRKYNLFYTCNTWVNNALKACNQRACLWTATDKGIFYQYRNVIEC
jgi:uncharacterized protein (TIGR02117 family)